MQPFPRLFYVKYHWNMEIIRLRFRFCVNMRFYLKPGISNTSAMPTKSKSMSGLFKKNTCNPPTSGIVLIKGFITIRIIPCNYESKGLKVTVKFLINQYIETVKNAFSISYLEIPDSSLHTGQMERNVAIASIKNVQIHDDLIPIGVFIIHFHTTDAKRHSAKNDPFKFEAVQFVRFQTHSQCGLNWISHHFPYIMIHIWPHLLDNLLKTDNERVL